VTIDDGASLLNAICNVPAHPYTAQNQNISSFQMPSSIGLNSPSILQGKSAR